MNVSYLKKGLSLRKTTKFSILERKLLGAEIRDLLTEDRDIVAGNLTRHKR